MALTKAQKENAEKNRRYWEQREAEQLKHNITEEKEFDKQLHRIYEDMLDKIQNEINAFYGRYASKEGITIAEAKKRVSSLDIKAYERKAKRYVKEKNFSAEANEEMRLYNLTMKVNRLELLKANIGLEMIAGHDEIKKFMEGILKGRTEDELKRQAGFLGKSITNNGKAARVIVNGSFHNATFSDRIWQYHDLMKADLSKILQTGLIQGKNPRAIGKELYKYWYGNDPRTGGGAQYCMERLMRTELARVQTEAQKESFIRNGFSMYTFHTNSGCCDICAALNGKHFKIEKMMPGVNASPMHPHCRCSASAYEDTEEYNDWLDYVSNGGTTAEWEAQQNNPENVKGLVKPTRPRRTDYDNDDDYEAAREQYRKDRETYQQRLDGHVEKMANSKQVFKNTDDLLAWAKKTGVTVTDDVLKNIDLRSFNEVKTTLEEMFTKYPQVKAFDIEDFDGKMIRTSFNIGTTNDGLLSANGGFNFSKRLFADYENGLREGLELMTTGYNVQGDGTFASLVRHEYGHNVQSYIELQMSNKYHHNVDDWRIHYETLAEKKEAEKAYFAERDKYEKELRSLVKIQGASEYASFNTSELFAEGFAEYTSGGNTEFGKAFGEFLERWYK